MSALWSHLLITFCLLYQLMPADGCFLLTLQGRHLWHLIKPFRSSIKPLDRKKRTRGKRGGKKKAKTRTIAQCTKPTIYNVERFFIDKEYYNKGDSMTVWCKSGYYPSSSTMRCNNPPRWTPPTITCRAQCTKPTIGNVDFISQDKEYYNNGEEVRVWCKSGYYPSSDKMTCDNPPRWTPPTVTCTEQCAKPTIYKALIPEDKKYYDKNEEITVQCQSGYYPSSSTMRCENPGTFQAWTPPTVTCTAQCTKPSIDNVYRLSEDKKYYKEGESVTVQCIEGYYPSSATMICIFPPWWTPSSVTCIAQCTKPIIDNVDFISIDKEYYNNGEEITVWCKSGYYPSSNRMSCDDPPQWTPPTITCIAQCTKPTIDNVDFISIDKEYYNNGEEITVRCKSGYYPPSYTMRCNNLYTPHEWTPSTVTCTALCKKLEGRIMKMVPEKRFYNIWDTVTVKCPVGYRNPHPSVQCVNHGTSIDWNNPPQCIAQCKKPSTGNVYSLSTDKKYYNNGEEVRVQCKSRYYPSSFTMRCDNPRTSQEWTPPTVTCIAHCKKPTINNVYNIYENKEYYKKGEEVAVECNSGYYPSSDTMRCNSPNTPQEWTPTTVTCIAQCNKPTIEHVYRLSIDKEYYNKGEEVRVQCKSGYYPSSDKVTCDNPRTQQEWTPPFVACIGVTMVDWKVTWTSISTWISCTPQCSDTWRITVQCCPVQGYDGSCSTLYGKSVTFTDLQPSSQYRIYTMLRSQWGQLLGSLESGDIRTEESAPGQPEITKVPSMEDTMIKWRLSERWGEITGFQINISAWRDYNVSFAVDGSLNFPPNVREYKIPLQYGTNYTIALRGFTSAGAGEVTTQNIETDFGVSSRPDLMTFPAMENSTIKLKIPYNWENIIVFQMNISARRDYNVSFNVYESIQFPPNVREYQIPVQCGTNYTITFRGLTSTGAEKITAWTTETDIGDPPRHPENTLREGSTLQLYPVPDENGPISSYEIIVYMGQDGDSGSNCIQYSNTPYNSIWNLSHYTAAVLPAETLTGPRTFILGDDHHYNGFHNAPLIPSHNYTVYIRVTSRWEMVEKSSCAFAGFIGALTAERKDGSVVIVLSLPSLGLIITMLILKFLALVGLAVIPLTPWMGMGNAAERREKKRTTISTEDVDDDEASEGLGEAENRI